MAVRTIDKNAIPLNAYLRADPHSQHFKFSTESRELVDHDMFWDRDGLYLDYSEIKHHRIQVAEGISQSSSKQILREDDCDNWIDDNILGLNFSKLFVIQGYAGCGKTTFINHIIQKSTAVHYTIIDIGECWKYTQEPYIFFNESLNAFDSLLSEIGSLKRWTRRKVWNKFIDLASDQDLKGLDSELKIIVQDFNNMYSETRKWKDLQGKLYKYLANNYSQSGKKQKLWHSVGQTQIIIILLILFRCALYFEVDNRLGNFTLIFDNLDVISNPAIPAENVLLLWGVIDEYIRCCNKYNLRAKEKLPVFKILITVRKVLFSHITSHLPDLEMNVGRDSICANVCDISTLYQAKEIIYHRISYWKKHLTNDEIIRKLDRLKILMSVHEDSELDEDKNLEYDNEPLNCINLDAFFNHNYRALSNVLSEFVENSVYNVLFTYKGNHFEDWQKVAATLFSLSLLYRTEKVWNSMGFGCKDFDTIDYPTTLNRLILNYLYISRRGQTLYKYAGDRRDMPAENYVSLRQLIDIFKKVSFSTIKSDLNEEQIRAKRKLTTISEMEDLIIDRLANMCARNPISIHGQAVGYDSDDDEHWRRPLYYVGGVKLNHTAATHDELRDYFKLCISKKKSKQVLFSLTDEGFILIRDVVANFEFYSGRYCDKSNGAPVKPLYQAMSVDELNTLIQPVYDAIAKCCMRSLLFKEEYMKKYGLNVNAYLRQYFHPRTNPRFNGCQGTKELEGRSFRPQLHIVRVIFSHIAYFDKVREYFLNCNDENKEMCECLTVWIKRYLKLYETNFYSILAGTTCNSDNNVYDELINLNG